MLRTFPSAWRILLGASLPVLSGASAPLGGNPGARLGAILNTSAFASLTERFTAGV